MVARVQNAGFDRITATLAALPWWVQAGTGGGAAKTDVDVMTPAVAARGLCVASQGSMSDVPNSTLIVAAMITATVNEIISEFGVFDDAVGGNMALYAEMGPITLKPGDSIVFTTDLTFI